MPAEPLPEQLTVDSVAETLARLREGDLMAIEPLFARYAQSLLGLALRITASKADAEDVVQDVFVGLPIAIRSYTENGQFESWLRRVTVRTCLMSLRRDRRRHEVQLDERGSSNPTNTLLSQFAVEEAINRLPTPLRVVFVLKEIEHHTHAEIASMLGINQGTSQVRLFRAIRILRNTLGTQNDNLIVSHRTF